jgi:hypothetical protein
MAPFVVQIVVTLLARALMRSWRDAIRTGLGIMFLFTAASHFSGMKHDLAAMIPPPFTGELWVIYLTGVMQIAGAIGLMISRTQGGLPGASPLCWSASFPPTSTPLWLM